MSTFIELSNSNDRVLVDERDVEYLRVFNWHRITCFNGPHLHYAATNLKEKINGYRYIRMHRLIMDARRGQTIDHVNRNGLDNRRENLRFCTQAENCWNSIKKRHGKSKFKGVYKVGRKFRASITVNGERSYLGYFRTETEAGAAYNKAATELMGKFARVNEFESYEVSV